jgi:hypothetical protein
MNLPLLLLALASTPEPLLAQTDAPDPDVPLSSQARSAQTFVLPTAVTPAAGTVTAALTVAYPFNLAAAPTLSYTPIDGLTLQVGGLYWLDQGIAIAGQAKLRVARTSGGGLTLALVGGGGHFAFDGPAKDPFGYGGAVVSACLGSSCPVLLSAFGAAFAGYDEARVRLWAGGSAILRASSSFQLVAEVQGGQGWALPLATVAARLTFGAWTLDAGALVPVIKGTFPMPMVTLGRAF